MAYDNRNSGALFTNKDKDDDHPKWPDYQGSIDIEGKQFWINAWIKTAEKGKMKGEKFMSLTVNPKDSQRNEPPSGGGDRPF